MSRDSAKTGKIASGKHEWSLVWVLLDQNLVGNQVLSVDQLYIPYCHGRLTHTRTYYVHCSAEHHRLASHQATWSSSQACLRHCESRKEVR